MILKKSPADEAREKMALETKEEKEKARLLEFLVTEKKITEDVVAQSNYAKDELQVLQGAWRSQIHNIINDLPESQENDIYNQIIEPFQEAILSHLKGLEKKLTFDPVMMEVKTLAETIKQELDRDLKSLLKRYDLEFHVSRSDGIQGKKIRCEPFKVVEIIRNLVKNSQKAIELIGGQSAQSNRDKARINLILGWAKRQLGQLDAAEVFLQKGIKLYPRSPRLHYELGRIYQKRNDSEKAMQAYAQALRLVYPEE